ncbi:MAG TPA: hypothetical protein VK195_13780 [Burkholderiaceae bacterium]|nr:hypothetical protein [Burkholderiaceae bacterium]
MRFIKMLLVFVGIAAFCGISSAGNGDLNTQFRGWIGKDQKGYFLDTSQWHHCWGGQGGSCGSISLSTGNSTCHSQGFDIGGNWAPPQLGGMGIHGGYNRSWTACNNRSETVTCSPNPGWKGRAVINFSKRWGKMHVVGGDNYLTLKSSCPAGWRSDWMGGQRWRCTYTGGSYDRDGYLPEWRGSSCNYARN